MGETAEDNNLFFTCSLLEYIARKTKNTKKYMNWQRFIIQKT